LVKYLFGINSLSYHTEFRTNINLRGQ